MQTIDPYKEGGKAYAKGFALGFFVGIALSIIAGRWLITVPLLLGLLFGAIAFERKIN